MKVSVSNEIQIINFTQVFLYMILNSTMLDNDANYTGTALGDGMIKWKDEQPRL